MKTRRQRVGAWGERLAERYLIEHGCQVLGRNLRTAYGEIDLLARQGEELIFVEVKTRTNRSYGLPETGITVKKREHMLNAAQAYLLSRPEFENSSWRIDVVAILGRPEDPSPQIEYFENALS
jgi:putative endonuclease